MSTRFHKSGSRSGSGFIFNHYQNKINKIRFIIIQNLLFQKMILRHLEKSWWCIKKQTQKVVQFSFDCLISLIHSLVTRLSMRWFSSFEVLELHFWTTCLLFKSLLFSIANMNQTMTTELFEQLSEQWRKVSSRKSSGK